MAGRRAGSNAGLCIQNAPLKVPPSISKFCPVM
jgi:hypothetical protein